MDKTEIRIRNHQKILVFTCHMSMSQYARLNESRGPGNNFGIYTMHYYLVERITGIGNSKDQLVKLDKQNLHESNELSSERTHN